jgi:hypothetical protein
MYRPALFVPLQATLLMIVTLTAVPSHADGTFKPVPNNWQIECLAKI